MATLSSHPSLELVKGLYLGDPGSGKTGSLTSLVDAGYQLLIYDFDNLLTPLVQYILKECPDKISNVHYQTFTDKLKSPAMGPGMMQGKVLKVNPFLDGPAKAFPGALKQLTKWSTEDEDFGDPGQLGHKWIVVIDTLTTLSEAIFRYCEALNPGALEPQATYFAAQRMLLNVLSLLGSDAFATNVLVLAHIDYDKNHLNMTKGFPRSIGSALNTKIGGNFNCILMAEDQKWIRTRSTGVVDLKNPIDWKLEEKLPLGTGLSIFFEKIVGLPK